jgi:hypothetical protein
LLVDLQNIKICFNVYFVNVCIALEYDPKV